MTKLRTPAGSLDDLFLHDRDDSRRGFDREVAARHHDAIGNVEDFIQVLDRFGPFQLGHNGDVLLFRIDLTNGLTQGDDVGCRTNERGGDHVHFVFQAELKVAAVFFGEGGDVQSGAR